MIKAFAIVAGIIGAVLGFAVTLMALALVDFGNPADPIMSGLLALVVFAPAGALAGLVLGTSSACRLRDKRSTGSLAEQQHQGARYCRCDGRPWQLWLQLLRRYNGDALAQLRTPPTRCFSLKFVSLPARAADYRPRHQDRTADRPEPYAGRIAARSVPSRRPPAGDRRDGRTDFSHRQSPIGRQDRRPTRALVSHRPDRQGASHRRTPDPSGGTPDGSEIRYRAKWPGQK